MNIAELKRIVAEYETRTGNTADAYEEFVAGQCAPPADPEASFLFAIADKFYSTCRPITAADIVDAMREDEVFRAIAPVRLRRATEIGRWLARCAGQHWDDVRITKLVRMPRGWGYSVVRSH